MHARNRNGHKIFASIASSQIGWLQWRRSEIVTVTGTSLRAAPNDKWYSPRSNGKATKEAGTRNEP